METIIIFGIVDCIGSYAASTFKIKIKNTNTFGTNNICALQG